MTEKKKPKVLIVDDEVEIVDLLEKILGGEDFLIEKAYGGVEAMDLLKKDFFNLVLTDVQMPEVNGLEILDYVADLKKTEIILFSGFGLISEEEAKKRGALMLLHKPGDLMGLTEVLKKSLAN